jgi:hypothetical protein
VKWQQSNIPFARRFERYLDYSFFEHQVGVARSFLRAALVVCCGGEL